MRLSKIISFFFLLTVSSWASTAFAVASCAACYQGGYTAGCTTCAGAAETAFKTIQSAIITSEEAIQVSLGVAPPNPSVGFPALSDTVKGAFSAQTKSLTDVLETSSKTIVSAIQRVPADRVKARANESKIQNEVIGLDKAGCRSVDYGVVAGSKGRSSLGSGWSWIQGGEMRGDSDDADGGINAKQGAAALTSDLESQALTRVGQKLREMRENAGDPQAAPSELLKPSLLVAQGSRVLSDEPDDTGVSDSERMDILIQYLTADSPSLGPFLEKSASTPGMMKRATSENLVAMEQSLSIGVLNKLMRNRQKHPGSIGTEDYLREVMSEPDLEMVSEDDFTYLTTHHRASDSKWVARVDVSDEFALKQYAQMEAEELARKYKRWVLKRDTNLLLSQIVSNVIEEERP